MANPLLKISNCASAVRSLVAATAKTGNRRSQHEEDRHLNVRSSDYLWKLDHDRQHPRRQQPGLIGRRRAQGISPNRAFRSSPEPKLRNEAATGSPRYSASAISGFPFHSSGAA